jgi:hypothetical protein
MRFRGLDSNGDWMLGQGLGSYARDAAALALDIDTRIRCWYGNCPFDPQFGVDWLNRMDKLQRDNLLIELQRMILQTNGVVRINQVTYDHNTVTRELSVTYDIQTIYSASFRATVAALAGVANA